MVRSLAFFALFAVVAALPSTFSLNAASDGTSKSSEVQGSYTNQSLKPAVTPYVVAGGKLMQKRADDDDDDDDGADDDDDNDDDDSVDAQTSNVGVITSTMEPSSASVVASSASASVDKPTTASSITRTRPHYTSFVTARAEAVQQGQVSAGNGVKTLSEATKGSTHAHYTMFYGAREEQGDQEEEGEGCDDDDDDGDDDDNNNDNDDDDDDDEEEDK